MQKSKNPRGAMRFNARQNTAPPRFCKKLFVYYLLLLLFSSLFFNFARISYNLLNYLRKWQRHPQLERRQQRPPRRPGQRVEDAPSELSHTLHTSTRCWSKCTPTLASPREACPSSTRSSTISSRDSPLRLLVCPATTRRAPSLPARSRPPSAFSSPENLPSTPCPRAPRLLPSSRPPPSLLKRIHRANKHIILIQTSMLSRLINLKIIKTKTNKKHQKNKEFH